MNYTMCLDNIIVGWFYTGVGLIVGIIGTALWYEGKKRVTGRSADRKTDRTGQ